MPEPIENSTGQVKAWMLLVAGATIAGAFLRFEHIAARSFWYDEAMSIGFARLPIVQFIKILWRREVNMALYYALLKPWLWLGLSETAVRSLSAIAGTLTIPAVYGIGRRLFDHETGAVAAVLLAFNAFAIRYSQEARAYALVALLVTLATLLLVKAVEEHTRRAWTWYAVCATAAVYAHLLAVLALAAHAVWFLAGAWGGERDDLRQALRAVKIIVIACVPLAVFSLNVGSLPILWVQPTTWQSVSQFFIELGGNSAAATIACMALWIVGLAVTLAMREQRRRASLVWLWLLLPIGTVLLLSVWRPIFIARYLLLCVPAGALGAAVGIRSLRWLPLRALATIAVLVLVARAAPTAYTDTMGSVLQDYRGATKYILDEAKPGDALFFYMSPTIAAYDIYRDGRKGPEVIYPAHGPGKQYRDLITEPLAEVILDIPMDRPRVFLMISEFPRKQRDLGEDVVRAWLAHRYRTVATAKFTNVEVVTFAK